MASWKIIRLAALATLSMALIASPSFTPAFAAGGGVGGGGGTARGDDEFLTRVKIRARQAMKHARHRSLAAARRAIIDPAAVEEIDRKSVV